MPRREREPGLSDLTKAELYERAQELSVPGRSKMHRGYLLRDVLKAG